MAPDKLTIPLTDDQQRQIHAATGRSPKELSINLAVMGHLTAQDLEKVAGGVQKIRESAT
jgi:hypothetical protein